MFGTAIHWTTFFYLLVDTVIVLLTFYLYKKNTQSNFKRFLVVGLLFVAYNSTGGFLPMDGFPAPSIFQYIITYGVAISLCLYIVYYLYKEYDIVVLRVHFSIKNLAILATASFVTLFLIPYFLTESLDSARLLFTVPISIFVFVLLGFFYKRISNPTNPNPFFLRRNRLSILCVSCIGLLPILTVIGDYQWLTFTVMNLAFYAITAIEIDRYLYLLENKTRLYEVFALNKALTDDRLKPKIIYENLTRREVEIALSILGKATYKKIGEDLFIAESTVSKHASNIFKKTGVKNRREFLRQFRMKNM